MRKRGKSDCRAETARELADGGKAELGVQQGERSLGGQPQVAEKTRMEARFEVEPSEPTCFSSNLLNRCGLSGLTTLTFSLRFLLC